MYTALQNSIMQQHLAAPTVPRFAHCAVTPCSPYTNTTFRRNRPSRSPPVSHAFQNAFPLPASPSTDDESTISGATQRAPLIKRHTKSFFLTVYQHFPGLDVPAGGRYVYRGRSGRDMNSNWSVRYWQINCTEVRLSYISRRMSSACLAAHWDLFTQQRVFRNCDHIRYILFRGGARNALWACLLRSTQDWHANYRCLFCDEARLHCSRREPRNVGDEMWFDK
jgi:hypothetical protein